MPDQIKNLLIGAFILSGIGILVFVVLFLHPTVGNEGQFLRVRFANIDKVNVGTRVTFAGRPVGEVSKIEEIEAPRPDLYYKGKVYIYELTLRVDSSIDIYNSDEVGLRTSGLLGERSVALTPRAPKKKGFVLKKMGYDDILFATESASLEETFAEFNDFATRAEATLESLTEQIDELKHHRTIEQISTTFRNLAEITGALNKPKDWADTLANLKKSSENANLFLDSARVVSDQIGRGEGTLGRAIMTDDLYLHLQAVLSKAEITMDDINHYGLLFHLDKGWQRLRARRLNLMQKLRCPQQFRNFFEDELDLINTSLSRVYMVLEDTACICDPEDLLCDRHFEQVFAELLRRVAGLEENIRMYNQQLIHVHEDRSCRKCHP